MGLDNAQSLAILLATPAGVAVVGALLWWRVGSVEREVRDLRRERHDMSATVAELKGSVQLMESLVTDWFNSLGRRRGGDK